MDPEIVDDALFGLRKEIGWFRKQAHLVNVKAVTRRHWEKAFAHFAIVEREVKDLQEICVNQRKRIEWIQAELTKVTQAKRKKDES